MHPCLQLSATALAQQYRAGELRAIDVINAHIEHIRRINPDVNALVQTRFEDARSEARLADQRFRSGALAPLPPLLGIPCTLRENFAMTGFEQTAGLGSCRGRMAVMDAPVVQRLRAAGAIVLGVTNISDSNMSLDTRNGVYGLTGNAYDSHRVAGGGSGGEAVMVGSGASVFGLGADMGGSLRLPACLNGIFAHKPGPGLISNTGLQPASLGELDPAITSVGPLARTAKDLVMLMHILVEPEARIEDAESVGLATLRVINIPDNSRQRIPQEQQSLQREAMQHLQVMGCLTSELRLPAFRDAWLVWSAYLADMAHKQAGDANVADEIGTLRKLLDLPLVNRAQNLPALMSALADRLPLPRDNYLVRGQTMRDQLLELIRDDGVLLMPTYQGVAPRRQWPLLSRQAFAYTVLFNLFGFPVTQVPLGLSREGLPLGVQLVAAPGKDHLTLALAMELEHKFGGWVPPWNIERQQEVSVA